MMSPRQQLVYDCLSAADSVRYCYVPAADVRDAAELLGDPDVCSGGIEPDRTDRRATFMSHESWDDLWDHVRATLTTFDAAQLRINPKYLAPDAPQWLKDHARHYPTDV